VLPVSSIATSVPSNAERLVTDVPGDGEGEGVDDGVGDGDELPGPEVPACGARLRSVSATTATTTRITDAAAGSRVYGSATNRRHPLTDRQRPR
jgi:hypothetical protein